MHSSIASDPIVHHDTARRATRRHNAEDCSEVFCNSKSTKNALKSISHAIRAALSIIDTPSATLSPGNSASHAYYVQSEPAFVDVHWFQHYDEPVKVRSSDGENFSIGFAPIIELPYHELVASARVANEQIYQWYTHANLKS